MTANPDHQAVVAMREAIDVVEESYEFMLAYAAQGRKREPEDESVSRIRHYLTRFSGALDQMEEAVPAILTTDTGQPFRDRFQGDIAVARSVLALLLEQPSITSDMIDNTNGLIAIRAFMTDLFFVDQAILPAR
jgi:acyl-CoA reductase-like NAD-dependent aldehyde dehydrogenase